MHLIREAAIEENASVFLTNSQTHPVEAIHDGVTHIHPLIPERELRSLVPRDIRSFLNLGSPDSNRFADFAKSFSKGAATIQPEFQQLRVSQTLFLDFSMSYLAQLLESYCNSPDLLDIIPNLLQHTIVRADKLHEQPEAGSAATVVSWHKVNSLQVQVIPAVSRPLFEDQKTYFLIGLTGDLGLSLCEWMIDHGARYFALASRNPTVADEIITHLQQKGAVIRIFPLDVSNTESLKAVHNDICCSMPPIAGVANGALVVRDHPFDTMSLEELEAVFEPKVVGSRNVDQLFHSTDLDFFILFGSAATVVGKPGQCSYNAANLFMSALATQRRKRDLAASIMHFGALLGLGYVHNKAEPIIEARFRQDDISAITETDFHAVFAQTVLSGRPGSGMSPEVISGLGTEVHTTWRTMPRFSHCPVNTEEVSTVEQANDFNKQSHNIRDRLRNCENNQDALLVVKTTIVKKIAVALGRPGAAIDEHVGLISLGLDSLIAVEIRSWILKTLNVDVPVLKLLGGPSLLDLCHDVLGKLGSSSMPNDFHTQTDRNIMNGNRFNSNSDNLTQRTSTSSTTSDHASTRTTDLERSAKTTLNAIKGSELDSISPAKDVVSSTENRPASTPTTYERTGDMSHAQSQLYFLHEYLHNNAQNVAYHGRFQGHLDIKRLEFALWVVGKRHEAMRSAFFVDKSTTRHVQAVLREPRIILEHITTSSDSKAQLIVDSVKGFALDIGNGVVMKVTVLTRSPSLHYITFSHHHIALDGFSWEILIKDLARAYYGGLESISTVSGIEQSMDMARRQLEALTSRNLVPVMNYWKDVYRSIPQPLPLFPFTKVTSRPTLKDFMVDTSVVNLPDSLAHSVERATSKIGVTAFHFHLASLATFLARCLHIDDIAIGVVDANRRKAQDMDTVGYFLNMLPVRISLKQTERFEKVAKKSSEAALAAMTHSYAPLDMVIGSLGVSPSTDHHPLFQVAINYRNGPSNETEFLTFL
jgi:NAD(P)-dependent dehydrogenase (short-subunit alcohol dehydrogenase family)